MRCKLNQVNVVLVSISTVLAGACLLTVQAQSKPVQNSSIQQRFDGYWKLIQGPDAGFGKRRSLLAAREYDKLFASEQNAANIKTTSNSDLKLLFRAANLAAFYTFEIKYSHNMSLDLAEMEKRHIASEPDYRDMYEALVNTRMFDSARQFYKAHPLAALSPLPEYRDEAGNTENGQPTILMVSTDKREMTRRPVDLDVPAKVIIFADPLCHFSADFLHAIGPYPKLSDVLERHAIWMTPPDGVLHFDTLQKWDSAHPEQHINIMYKLKNWSMIKVIQVPMFYFLQNGKLVTTVVGWPKGGNIGKLRSALKQIGLWK